MTLLRFIPGSFLRLTLPDDSYGYGRLRESHVMSIYDFRTEKPVSDFDQIESNPIIFTVVVHKSALTKWGFIGKKPLEEEMKQPFLQFWQDIGNFRNCRIFDMEGNERPATPEECEGLERWAVWEAEHVEGRLLDTFMGRPNPNVEHLKVRYEDHPNVKRKSGE